MNASSTTLQIKNNAEVSLTDGTAVGRVDRVVIDPRTRELSHIVVRKGLLFKVDKVVPMAWIVDATEGGVTLRAERKDMDDLPEYEEELYVRVSEDERIDPRPTGITQLYWYPLGMGSPSHVPILPAERYHVQTQQNIPEGTVGLKEGAKVLTRDDKHVGNVDEVLTDARTDQVIGLVISQGLLFKEHRRVPITWVEEITEENVRLLVGQRQLEALGFEAN